MNIGEAFRYGQPATFPPSVEAVEGMRNWWHVTASPDESELPLIKLDSGINAPKPIAGRTPLVALRSSPHKVGQESTPWEDVLRPDEGYARYYGDSKPGSGVDAHNTLGNRRMLDAFRCHAEEGRSDRLNAPPVLIFEAFPFAGRPKGQIRFQGVAVIDRAELIVQRDPRGRGTFTNFRYDLVILDLAADGDRIDWQWINARRDGALSPEAALAAAPSAWREWVKVGRSALDGLQRRVVKRQRIPVEEQRPANGSPELEVLEWIVEFYAGRQHRFEALAEFVTGEVLRSQGLTFRQGWITRGGGDGGVDFVGSVDLDPEASFPSSRLVLLGQAKCEALKTPTNGNHIARLAARLRRGWVGAYVTTSFFSPRVQEEILADRYPLILISGFRLATTLRRHLEGTGRGLEDFVREVDSGYPSRIGLGDPEQVLL